MSITSHRCAFIIPSLLLSMIGLPARSEAAAGSGPRERLLADFGWRFHLGNEWGPAQNLAKAGSGYGPASPEFSDASWRRVDLPHDWAVELPFDRKADASHGFKALGDGFPQNSVGWYRRTFDVPKSDAGRRIWLEFDGVFRDSTVFVNGWFVGRHESGYGSFRYDITDVLKVGGKNVVAVRVDASQTEGWFYEGAGIYRHVWLVKVSPLAVAPDGVFVYSRFKNNVPEGAAEVHLQTRLDNAGAKTADCHGDLDDRRLPTERRPPRCAEPRRSTPEVRWTWWQTARLNAPELWSPETPRLYRVVTSVASAGKVTDQLTTELGIRTVAFDPDKGFLLNGKPYVIKGTCNHQDHAGVGSALPDRLQYYRVAKLKEMGSNAYRTAHNPPTPELLEACDRLGMLVMDENRLLGSDSLHLAVARGLRAPRPQPPERRDLVDRQRGVDGSGHARGAPGGGDDARCDQAPGPDPTGHLRRARRQRVHGHQRDHRGARVELPRRQGHGRLPRGPSTAAERRQRAGKHRLHARHLRATTSSAAT